MPTVEEDRALIQRQMSAGLQEMTAYWETANAPARQVDPAVARKQAAAERQQDEADSEMVLWILFDNFTADAIRDYAPSRLKPVIQALKQALGGHNPDGTTMPGARRLETFDRSLDRLKVILAHADARQQGRLAGWRKDLLRAEARERVAAAVLLDGQVFEIADDSHPREQGALLRAALPKLVETLRLANEQYLKIHSADLDAAIERQLAGHGVRGPERAASRLAQWGNVLTLAGDWLKLNDAEFQRELTHINGFISGVATYAELVKVVVEMAGAAVGVTATLASSIAALSGDFALAAAASGVAAQVGHVVGKLVAAIEIVHGIFTAIDPDASVQKRIDGAVEATTGVAQLVLGTPAGVALGATYLLVKTAGYLYSEAAIGWEIGVLRELFDVFAGELDGELRLSRTTQIAGALARTETNPARAAALDEIRAGAVTALAGRLGRFLDDCLASSPGRGFGSERNQFRIPGNVPLFAEVFAPLQPRRGVSSTPDVLALAADVAAKIKWIFQHAAGLPKALATRMRLADFERAETKREAETRQRGRQ
jgi:hypothetical protein